MRLLKSEQAIIAPEKLRDYLLNPGHPQNRGKARLFAALGYTRNSWQVLESDIRTQHLVLEAREGRSHAYGRTFEIVGMLRGPAGASIIMTVWMYDRGSDIPRFLTARRA